MFRHRNIHKRNWTSPDEKTNNQTDHVLTDERRHSNILLFDIRSFIRADCDTNHYLVVAKVRQRLSASKREAQKFYMGRFNLRKPNYMEVKKQYQVTISETFAALEDLYDDHENDMDMNRAC
jgi:hypothetical protein